MDESPKRGLLAAYRRLLGPLIRILIRNGVSYSEFSDAAKEAYVEVASKDFRVKRGQITSTRVAALTGLQQKEVRDIEDAKFRDAGDGSQSNLDDIAGVLYGWHTDSDFTGPYGVPLELRFSEKGNLDFRELVRRHIGTVDPQPLLEELLKIGAIAETEKGWFKALKRHYIPEATAPQGLDHLARSVEDFVTTLDHNRLEDESRKRLFERQVYTEEGITPEDLERFKQFANHRSQLLLEEIDNWISQLDDPRPGTKKKLSTGLGIYHYIREESAEEV